MRTVVCHSIVADRPTINNRTYRRGLLERMARECNHDSPIFVTDKFVMGSKPQLTDIVGTADNFQMTSSGSISASVQLLSGSRVTEEMLDWLDFSPMMYGTVGEDGVVLDDTHITYFALIPKN